MSGIPAYRLINGRLSRRPIDYRVTASYVVIAIGLAAFWAGVGHLLGVF